MTQTHCKTHQQLIKELVVILRRARAGPRQRNGRGRSTEITKKWRKMEERMRKGAHAIVSASVGVMAMETLVAVSCDFKREREND